MKILRDVQCFAGVRVVNVNVSDLDVVWCCFVQDFCASLKKNLQGPVIV